MWVRLKRGSFCISLQIVTSEGNDGGSKLASSGKLRVRDNAEDSFDSQTVMH